MDNEIVNGTGPIDEAGVESVADAALAAVGLDDSGSHPTAVVDPAAEDGAAPDADQAGTVKPEEANKGGMLNDEDLQKPAYLREKAAERFEKLTAGYKAATEENAELKSKLEGINSGLELFRDLGFSDEHAASDLVGFSSYRQALFSGDYGAAQEILLEQLRQLQMISGRGVDLGAADPLSSFPDLAERVAAHDLDRDTALEVARARAANQAASRQREGALETQRQQQQREQATKQAMSSVGEMVQRWRSSDPDFMRIAPILKARAEEIEASFPPHMWAKQIDMVYQSLTAALQDFGAQRQSTAHQPLRSSGASAGAPVPKTMAEAALAAVGLQGV